MKNSLKLLKKNFKKLLIGKYKTRKQILKKGSYYSRSSVNYSEMKYFKLKKINLKNFNKIKAFIFPPIQLPILNDKKVLDIRFNKNNIKIIYD